MMGDISIRSMSQEDAQEICSWEYSGQYRVYNNSWEKMAEQGISYADEETRRKEFYTLLLRWKDDRIFPPSPGRKGCRTWTGASTGPLRAGTWKGTGAGSGSGA